MTWKFIGSSFDGKPFSIDVWKHDWIPVGDNPAEVVDPRYGQSFKFSIYDVSANNSTVRFAAGEFSNGVWGFYRES
jgi:hypothetical protein